MSSPHCQQKAPKYSTWVQFQKRQNDLCSFPRLTIQYHSNPSLCPKHYHQTCWIWPVLWRPTRPPGTNTKKKKKERKRCPFHHKGLECKRRKSRDTQNNRQVWPYSTKWSRAKTNRVLSREHAGHRKHPLTTTQDMTLSMDITRWSIWKSYWLYYLQPKTEKLYIVSKNKTGSLLWLRSWAPIAKFRLQLKKVEKTTRPFRCDLQSNPLQLYSGSDKQI